MIHFGGNSGFQVLNVAFLYGVQHVLLVGYNMSMVKNQRHFFGEHPKGLNRGGNYASFVSSFNQIGKLHAPHITNVTPETALGCFKKMDLKDALDHYTALLRRPTGGDNLHWTFAEPKPVGKGSVDVKLRPDRGQ